MYHLHNQLITNHEIILFQFNIFFALCSNFRLQEKKKTNKKKLPLIVHILGCFKFLLLLCVRLAKLGNFTFFLIPNDHQTKKQENQNPRILCWTDKTTYIFQFYLESARKKKNFKFFGHIWTALILNVMVEGASWVASQNVGNSLLYLFR